MEQQTQGEDTHDQGGGGVSWYLALGLFILLVAPALAISHWLTQLG